MKRIDVHDKKFPTVTVSAIVDKKEEEDKEKKENTVLLQSGREETNGKDVSKNTLNHKLEDIDKNIEKSKESKDKESKKLDDLHKEEAQKKKKKISKSMIAFIIVAVISVIGIGVFYYFGIYKITQSRNSLAFKGNYVESYSSSTNVFKTTLPLLSAPHEPRSEESPLNGLLFTNAEITEMKKRRPIAVMINNHIEARPQSALNSADIVYETNAESGITRFLAFYWSDTTPAKVGSIRSLRQYYLEWLSEYDPILIHDGCAQTNNPLTNACGNVYSYGIKDIATYGAWRYNDGRRFAPHNEYSSLTKAWEYAEKLGWNNFPEIESWKFKKDEPNTSSASKVLIKFSTEVPANGNTYYATWVYDSTRNVYLRYTGDIAHIDQETNEQVYTKNLIIQRVKMMSAGDDKGRVIITTIGSGDAVFFIDGNVTYGTWSKTSRTARTHYYDSNGDEIKLNRGRVWVSAVPTDVGEYTILQ